MIKTPLPNPLAVLFEDMGLGPAALAAHFDLPVADVVAALNPSPSGALAALLRLLSHDHCYLTLRKAPPWQLVIENAAIDQLWRDNEWRKSVGLCWFPRVNMQVLELLNKLRADGLGNPEMVPVLQASFIPSPSGGDWTLSKVAHLFEAHRRNMKQIRQIPLDQYDRREEFRQYVVAILQARIAPDQPKAFARYEVTPQYEADRVTLAPARPMPLLLADVFRRSIERLGWFVEKRSGRPLWRWESPGYPPSLLTAGGEARITGTPAASA